MQLDWQPETPGGVEDARDFRTREGDALAEGVDRVDEVFPGERGDRLADDAVEIGLALADEPGRNRMRGEKRGADEDRAALAEAPRGAKRPALGRRFEAVAGLDLDRRHAFGDQRVETPERRGDQVLFARRARRAHGRENAAAGSGDLFVARAGEPHLELLGAIAAVDEMGVAVDEVRA